MSDEINRQRRSLLGGALVAGTAISGALTTDLAKPAGGAARAMAIDVHTHMYTRGWQEAVRKANDPHIKLTPGPSGADSMYYIWSSVGALGSEMFDWKLRIQKMDDAGVDLAIISLSSPNVFLVERARFR